MGNGTLTLCTTTLATLSPILLRTVPPWVRFCLDHDCGGVQPAVANLMEDDTDTAGMPLTVPVPCSDGR